MNTTTNFFSEIEKLISPGDEMNITITKSNNESGFIVSVLPKSKAQESALKSMAPIVLKGNVSEFDANFFENITTPMTKFIEFSEQAKAFEKQMEKAKEESAMEKAVKDEKKKLKEKIDKIFEGVKVAEEAKDVEKLRSIYKEIDALDKTSKHLKTITDLAAKIKSESIQPDMFSNPNQIDLEQQIKETEQFDNQTTLL